MLNIVSLLLVAQAAGDPTSTAAGALAQTAAQTAQTTAAAVAPRADWSPMIWIVLMLAVFFFFIILPQSRRAKKQVAFLAGLQKGDAVVTQSGLFGKIVGLADKVVTLEIAPQVRVRVDRTSIAGRDDYAGDTKERAA